MQLQSTSRATRRTLAVIVLLIGALLFASCGKALHTMTSNSGEYFDKWTDTTYTALPASYEPIVRGSEYGKINLAGVTNILYRIDGLPAMEYLCTEYGGVYHSKDVEPILFNEWEISSLKVCTDAAIIVSNETLTPEDETHASIIADTQTAWRDGVAIRYPSHLTPDENYTLRFESEDAPGLYFAIKLLAYDEDIYDVVVNEAGEEVEVNFGRYFLYDRYSRRCVATDDRIFRLLAGEEISP